MRQLLLLFALLASSLFAEEIKFGPTTITAEGPSSARYERQQRFLDRVEKKWAKKFYLTTWDVTIRAVPEELLEGLCFPKECMAASYWDPIAHTGTILIMDSIDYNKHARKELRKRHMTVRDDQRDSVLHEILHNVIRNMREEVAVVTLTSLLKP